MPNKYSRADRDLDGAPYDNGTYEFTWGREVERISACWDIDSAGLVGWLTYQPEDDSDLFTSISVDYAEQIGLSRLAVVMLVLGITGAQR